MTLPKTVAAEGTAPVARAGAGRGLRIAMVAACPFPWPRGTPLRIHRLSEALARRGHEVHVVTYHLGQPLEAAPFRTHRIPRVGFYRHHEAGPTYRKALVLDPLLGATLRRVLRERRFDVVHAHHAEGLLTARAAGVDAPLIYDAHTLLRDELPLYRLAVPRFLKRWIGRGLDASLPRLATHVIAVSEAVRRGLVGDDGGQAERVTVVPNGVECGRFRVPADRRWRPPPDTRVVVFAGSLAPYQGMEWLLEAFTAVLRRRPETRLLIVSLSIPPWLERRCAKLGIRDRVILVEAPFADVPAYLAGADVAVNPRVLGGGFPQKVLNYMCAGRPIVSFRGTIGCLEDGRSGLLVRDGDARAFAEAILRLLEDRALAARLGAAARRRASREFTWEETARKVEEVYARLLRERPVAAGSAGTGRG